MLTSREAIEVSCLSDMSDSDVTVFFSCRILKDVSTMSCLMIVILFLYDTASV